MVFDVCDENISVFKADIDSLRQGIHEVAKKKTKTSLTCSLTKELFSSLEIKTKEKSSKSMRDRVSCLGICFSKNNKVISNCLKIFKMRCETLLPQEEISQEIDDLKNEMGFLLHEVETYKKCKTRFIVKWLLNRKIKRLKNLINQFDTLNKSEFSADLTGSQKSLKLVEADSKVESSIEIDHAKKEDDQQTEARQVEKSLTSYQIKQRNRERVQHRIRERAEEREKQNEEQSLDLCSSINRVYENSDNRLLSSQEKRKRARIRQQNKKRDLAILRIETSLEQIKEGLDTIEKSRIHRSESPRVSSNQFLFEELKKASSERKIQSSDELEQKVLAAQEKSKSWASERSVPLFRSISEQIDKRSSELTVSTSDENNDWGEDNTNAAEKKDAKENVLSSVRNPSLVVRRPSFPLSDEQEKAITAKFELSKQESFHDLALGLKSINLTDQGTDSDDETDEDFWND